MRRIKINADDTKMDMSSMIDIVFLLLIFFIVMPFKTDHNILKNIMPKDEGPRKIAPLDTPESITIKVYRNQEAINIFRNQGVDFKINGKDVPIIMLSQYLAGIKGSHDDTPIVIDSGEQVPFHFIMKTLDSCKIQNFTNIKFSKTI